MTESNKVFFSTILITGMVVFLTVAGSIIFLYQTAVEEQKSRLLEVVKSQARFLKVVHDVTTDHCNSLKSTTHIECTDELESIFSQLPKVILATNSSFEDKKKSLNFFIAEKRNESVKYHIGTNKLTSQLIAYKNLIGKPMGKALQGETGVLETVDHFGNRILCAFTHVDSIELGIVAKILVKDLRRPFFKTGLLTYLSALVLLFLSGLMMKKIVSPLVTKLENQRVELKDKNESLYSRATTDILTGLCNRQHFDEQLNHSINQSKRHYTPISLVLIDIDNFKPINDTSGHLAGDILLKELSALFRKITRKTDIISRWGGDEFALICFDTDNDAIYSATTKICQMVSQHTFSCNIQITCSFGMTTYIPGESATDLITRADKALYEAKEKGRNQIIAK